MAYKKLAVLTGDLYKKTLSGKIDWEETALKEVYQTSVANYSLRISREAASVRITIVNELGNEIETFLDDDLSPAWFVEIGITDNPFIVMKSMYEIARRRALGSEQAIDNILRELDDDALPF